MFASLAAEGGAALVLVDFQAGVVGTLPGRDELGGRVAVLAGRARGAGVPVLHVRTAFRPGYPEVSEGNRLFRMIRDSGRFAEGAPDTAFADWAVPPDGEVVVTKHRVDPFWGTDLDLVLGGHGVRTLVVAGVLTSGAVLSTVRSAANRDLRVIVVEDCCADGSDEVHTTLLQRVFPMTAEVLPSSSFAG